MDIEFLLWLQGIRESSPPVVQALFSFAGSEAAMLVAMVIPLMTYWCVNKRVGVFALLAYGASSLCNSLVKDVACVYRPWVRDARLTPDPIAIKGATGYSFPSGHTQSTTSVLTGIAFPQKRHGPMVVALLFSAFVGFSRLFLSVHAPQDVVVALVEGCLFVFLTALALSWVEEGRGRDVIALVASAIATAACLAFITLKPYPRDYVGGELLVDPAEMIVDSYKTAAVFLAIVCGWFVERRWVRFRTGGLRPKTMALRMVAGIALVLLVHLPIGHLLMSLLGSYAGNFARYFASFLVGIAGVPALYVYLGDVFEGSWEREPTAGRRRR